MSSERGNDSLVLGRPIGEAAPASTDSRIQSQSQHVEPTSSPLQASTSVAPLSQTQSMSAAPSPPKLNHTRTAPTTYPIHPVAHQGFAAHHDGLGLPAIHDHEGEEDSLGPLRGGEHVPLEAGGLHGMPMPGSRARQIGKIGSLEKDRQAGTTGIATTDSSREGNTLAEKAARDLGLTSNANGHAQTNTRKTKNRSSTLDEKSGSTPPPAFTQIGRTATGTQIHRNVKTGGRDTVQGYGMVPIARQASLPPGVGPFGGTAPTGIDAEEGLWAVRSHQEELERQKTMDKKGPDPYAVRFEPGDKENPKVSSVLSHNLRDKC